MIALGPGAVKPISETMTESGCGSPGGNHSAIGMTPSQWRQSWLTGDRTVCLHWWRWARPDRDEGAHPGPRSKGSEC